MNRLGWIPQENLLNSNKFKHKKYNNIIVKDFLTNLNNNQ